MSVGFSRAFLQWAAVPAIALAAGSAQAQVSLNYDNLSSFEEPLAFEIGEATVLVGGLVDVPVRLALDDGIFRDDISGLPISGNMMKTLMTMRTMSRALFGPAGGA